MGAVNKLDEFHAHLDECARCRNQPFNLCATGALRIYEAASVLMVAIRSCHLHAPGFGDASVSLSVHMDEFFVIRQVPPGLDISREVFRFTDRSIAERRYFDEIVLVEMRGFFQAEISSF